MSEDRNLNRLSTRFFHGNYFATSLPNGALYSRQSLQDYSTSSASPNRTWVYFEGI